jgi:hypothetical protein
VSESRGGRGPAARVGRARGVRDGRAPASRGGPAPAARALRRLRWEARTLAGRYPGLYLPLLRWRYRPGQFQIPLREDTELVIDGFLRSGTTFAFTAFEMAQPRKVRVAHHSHAPAQVIAAARAGIPALVLIRPPEDAVLSLVVRLPELSIRQGLRGYVRFYRPLVPYRDRIVVARFEDAVSDLGAVVRRVNERWGTGFAEFDHTEENVARVLAVIEEGDRRQFGSGPELERASGRPSPARERMKDDLREAFRSPGLHRLRSLAEDLHRTFVGA